MKLFNTVCTRVYVHMHVCFKNEANLVRFMTDSGDKPKKTLWTL